MSAADYDTLQRLTLAELIALPFWQVVRFMEASDRARRLLILQALSPE